MIGKEFLPVTLEECRERGWDRPDFVYVTGDAYVDHPSFGVAIISRVLEKAGFRVAILPQPDYKSAAEFKKFGKPRLGFLVTSGNIDSMVAHYTVSLKKRTYDYYTPGGVMGKRPDRAVIVYCNRIREAYGDVPIIIGAWKRPCGVLPITIIGAIRCAAVFWWIPERIFFPTGWARRASSALQSFWTRAFP